MDVTVVAVTQTWNDEMANLTEWVWQAEKYSTDPEALTEFAGRLCYQSWSRPNANTAANRDYAANILMQRHYSVLEHAGFTVHIADVSRSLTHELVRHRHLSFSQLSQRFVKLDVETAPVYPPLFNDNETAQNIITHAWMSAVKSYWQLMDAAAQYDGVTRKQAAEAARCVLPNCTPTELVVTGNHRAWREFVEKRGSVYADAEIRQLAERIWECGTALAPNLWQDIDQPIPGGVK